MTTLIVLAVGALLFITESQEDAVAAARRLAEAGRLGEAIALLEDDSAHPRRLAGLAELLTRADRIPEAEEALRRALIAAPQAPLAATRASLLFRLSRYAEARDVLMQVIEREPDHPFAHYYLGAIALRTADSEAALQHAQRAISGFPSPGRSAARRGRTKRRGSFTAGSDPPRSRPPWLPFCVSVVKTVAPPEIGLTKVINRRTGPAA